MRLVRYLKKNPDIFFPIFLVILCFFLILTRMPFYDEAHAFILSKFSFTQLWQITRIEGHPLLWFSILKLINRFNFYPYPMFFLTWLTTSILIFFFWLKAPFEKYIKTLILLSFPFLGYFLIVARPYALTVLLLFFLAYFYKNSTNKPLIYSFLIILCANSTIMGLIGSLTFLIIFINKAIFEKLNKKTLFLSMLIILSGMLFLYLQLKNPQIPTKSDFFNSLIKENLTYYFIFPFKNFFQKPILTNIFQILSFMLFYSTLFIFYNKNKNSFIFILSSFILLDLLLLNIYRGAFWHYFFYFIFFIISLWIGWNEIKNIKLYKYFLITFLILAIFPSFYLQNKQITVLKEKKKYSQILSRIANDENLKNSKLYCFEKTSYLAPGLLPYLEKNNIFLYDIKGNKRNSFASYIETYTKSQKNIEDLDIFISSLENKNYLLVNNLSDTNIPKFITLESKKNKINLKLIELNKESIFAIYEIEL